MISSALVPLLDEFAAPPNGIYAVFPGAKHLPLRVRLWLDFLKAEYGRADFWAGAGPAPRTMTRAAPRAEIPTEFPR